MFVSKKFIPSLFTILNAFCGFLSIVNSANGQFDNAAWFIVYATLFDMFDGIVARLLHTTSDFGVELDSLSDVISFGAAPSFLVYTLFFRNYEGIGTAIASLILVFSAIRLARFNTELIGHDKDIFKGLPTPVASLTICAYTLYYHNNIFSNKISEYIMFILVILLSLLMVSRFAYFATPKINKKTFKKNIPLFVLFVVILAVIAITKGVAGFPIAALYIASGIINTIFKIFFKRKPPKAELRSQVKLS